MKGRPRIRIVRTPADQAVELIGWLVLAALWTLTLVNFAHLPDRIPTHFNGSGEINGYGGRASVFILPIVGTIAFAMMTVLNGFPHIFNYPIVITAENAVIQYTKATRLVRYVKGAVLTSFLLIQVRTIEGAKGGSNGLGGWFLPLSLSLVLVPVIFYVVSARRTKK